MTRSEDWKDHVLPTIADEVEQIISAFAEPRGGEKTIKIVPADRGIGFMYSEGEILVRDEYLERVLEILGHPPRRELEQSDSNPIQTVIAGATLLTSLGQFEAALDALAVIDERLGRGIATPNHVMTVAGGVGSSCPATEPEEVYYDTEPYPSVCPEGGGGVLIYMADTGLLDHPERGHPWLSGVRPGDAADRDPGDGQDPIPPYTAHGTFVAGVARCMAPSAEIIVTNAFSIAGSRAGSGPGTETRSGAQPRRGHLPSHRGLPVEA